MIFAVIFGYLIRLLGMTVVNGQSIPVIQPIVYSLPTPPALTGPLTPNDVLTKAERVHVNIIKGPSSFVSHEANLYAGTVDNKIYQVAACPPKLIASLSPPGCNTVKTCGQMLSLRRDPTTGLLVALDTYRGLFTVNPLTGQTQQIFSSATLINGRRPVHLNDMVISPNGVIFMTDSSDVYTYPNDVYICMDGRPTGRLIAYEIKSGITTEVLAKTFNFPNGLELTADGDLLVTETCRARIHRVSLKRPTWLHVSSFAVNLPGLPDNIRSSGRGTYWVAMSYPRYAGIRNPVDFNAGNPDYRSMGFNWLSRDQLKSYFVQRAIAVEIDSSGIVIGSLHDPTGTTLRMLTEIHESGGVINVGSHLVPYMARVILPETSGIKITVDGYIQVKRSRCELADGQVTATRERLLKQQTTSTAA
ncbi:adipocyte plasma membrane-associated protein-like [Physella acuta]|uniref:adipocyte plasma membrane-associated protein-like n=1 Tax=Physella acuta TaxID=109671 RepID=UPI0027DC2D39|nr:adipocyte plasma membrane-associated protein-like [Physella acuta]